MKLDKKKMNKFKKFDIDNDLVFEPEWVERAIQIKAINKANAKGTITYDSLQEIIDVDIEVEADLEIISLRDLSVRNETITIQLLKEYTFNVDSEELEIVDDIFDLEAIVFNEILSAIPVEKNKKNDTITKVSNDINLLSEEVYKKQKSKQTDPRWDKLKDLIKK